MVNFNSFDDKSFKMNNIKYVKNFIVINSGEIITVYNAYDTKLQLLTRTHFSNIRVNGILYENQFDLISDLAPLIFAKDGNTATTPSVYIQNYKSQFTYAGTNIFTVPSNLTHPVIAINNVPFYSYNLAGNDLTLNHTFAGGEIINISGFITNSNLVNDDKTDKGGYAGTAQDIVDMIGNIGSVNAFVYTQASPILVWDFTHNLNKYIPVVVIDTAGTTVIGDVKYVTPNRIIITFNSATAGKAYL